MSSLSPGDKIRYLKVGTGTVERHACPPGQCGDRYTLHRYWVHFDSPRCGPGNQLVWLWQSDRITT